MSAGREAATGCVGVAVKLKEEAVPVFWFPAGVTGWLELDEEIGLGDADSLTAGTKTGWEILISDSNVYVTNGAVDVSAELGSSPERVASNAVDITSELLSSSSECVARNADVVVIEVSTESLGV